jgi:hypothetical protein
MRATSWPIRPTPATRRVRPAHSPPVRPSRLKRAQWSNCSGNRRNRAIHRRAACSATAREQYSGRHARGGRQRTGAHSARPGDGRNPSSAPAGPDLRCPRRRDLGLGAYAEQRGGGLDVAGRLGGLGRETGLQPGRKGRSQGRFFLRKRLVEEHVDTHADVRGALRIMLQQRVLTWICPLMIMSLSFRGASRVRRETLRRRHAVGAHTEVNEDG